MNAYAALRKLTSIQRNATRCLELQTSPDQQSAELLITARLEMIVIESEQLIRGLRGLTTQTDKQ